MHYTEGWVLFVVAFVILSGLTWLMARGEERIGAMVRQRRIRGAAA